MKKQDKTVYNRTVIDNDTGEVLNQEIVYKQSPEPNFIKLYLDCLCSFKGISKSLNPILLELLQHMSFASLQDPEGGQIIYLNAELKRRIAKSTNKTVKRIEQALTDFVKANVLKRIAVGTYQVNANLFGRGEWKDIKNIRAKFDFANGIIDAEIIKTNEQEIQKAPSERLTDDLTNFNDKQVSEDQLKKKASQKASESVKIKKLTRKQFFQLKPDILTTIKKQQFWVISKNNKNEIFTKSGSFYVPFLSTNPDEQLKRDIDFALDNYEDTQAESLF